MLGRRAPRGERRWWRLTICLLAGPVGAAACGVDVFDVASSPEGDAGDAGTSPESSVDPGAIDASEAEGGGAEPPVVDDFCATLSPQADFCDDFDRGALAERWDFIERVTDAGFFPHPDETARSRPNVLLVDRRTANPVAYVQKNFDAADVTRVDVQFDLKIARLATHRVDFAHLLLVTGAGTVVVPFGFDGRKMGLAASFYGEDDGGVKHKDFDSESGGVPAGRWARFSLTFDRAMKKAVVRAADFEEDINIDPEWPFYASSIVRVHLRLGAVDALNAAEPNYDLRYDNVVVRLTQ